MLAIKSDEWLHNVSTPQRIVPSKMITNLEAGSILYLGLKFIPVFQLNQ